MIPQKLSHYRVLEKIGAGGMGVVYRAHDEQLDRDVALKVLPSGMLADENARRRFRREAMALAKLNHPHVGAVHEFGQQDGVDFLVMELVTGISLDAKLAAGPLAEAEVLRLGAQLADGLDAAHSQGIVHRDLKPGNLRLTNDGRLKILDFGLAQWSQPEDTTAITETLSKVEHVSGTIPYMAPEQLRGQKADARTDIYSAGAVLYEMATGKRPFPNISGPPLIGAILEQQPAPPSSHNHKVSPALQSIVIKALDKDPNRRYQSAKELRVDLERLSTGVAPSHHQKPRRVWMWPAAGVAAVIAILAALNVGGWRDRLLRPAPPAATTPAVNSRRSVAVVGFKNLSGKPDQAWISTALAEMLTTELAAGEQLRTVPGENVARMKLDLSLGDEDSYGHETLVRIRKHLGSDLIVVGSYLALGKEGGGKIRLDFRVQDAVAGETLTAVSETGTENELLDLVSRTGADLRRKLGVGEVSAAQVSDVKASLPANAGAARLYAEGLAKLRIFEALQARDLLQRALVADPKHAPSHSVLAGAWSALGYDAKAQEEAKQAFDLSGNLSREEKLFIEGRYHELKRDWPKAIEIYRTLWGFFPDNLDYGLRLANTQTAAGRGKDALSTLDALHKLPPPAGDDARIDLMEAKAAGSLGDFKRQQSVAANAVAKGRAQGARLVVAQALLSEGLASERQGLTDPASASFAEARQLFMAAGDQQGAALALEYSGDVLYDKGDFSGSQKAFEGALDVFRQIGAQQSMSIALNRLGNAFYERGRLEEAKTYYEQTLKIDRETDSKAGIAGGLGNLANVLDSLGDLQGARRMNEEGLQAFTEIGDKRGTASTLANLAAVLQEMGDLDNAKKRYEQALQLHRETAHRRGEGYANYGLGDVLMAQGDLAEARKRSEEALAIRQQMGEADNVAQSQAQLAALSLEEGKPADAGTLAGDAAAEFEKDKSPESEAVARAVLARALLQQKKLPEAQKAAEQAIALSQKTTTRTPRLEAALSSAQVMAETGKTAEAVKTLENMLADATRLGYLPYQFEARLALGEIEIKSGKTAAGRTRLQALEQDARAKGFLLISQKANKPLSAARN
jgi:tetratricopeptide (TPR) repeat protein/TolB-like protein